MDYDFRNRTGASYNQQSGMYNRPTTTPPPSSSPQPMYGPSSLYPKVGGQSGHHSVVPPVGRPHSFNQAPPSSSAPSGMGIRVTIKPEFRITPPPQLSPQVGDIPRSNFQFDFDLERKILAEAEKESPNWSKLGLENLPPRTAQPLPTVRPNISVDPVVGKYIASGLNREAVPLAIAHYGDNPTKVREFVNGFTLLREMGFKSSSVAEALITYDSDMEAAAQFLTSSS